MLFKKGLGMLCANTRGFRKLSNPHFISTRKSDKHRNTHIYYPECIVTTDYYKPSEIVKMSIFGL